MWGKRNEFFFDRLKQVRHRIVQYKTGKNFEVTIEEAYKILDSFSPNPRKSCFIEGTILNKTYNSRGGGYDLSIIIPAYNTATYLERCINSILEQNSGYSVQCIVINDGSTDNSESVLARYVANRDFVIINQENKGVSIARNIGIDVASGRYIMFIDSDDRLATDAIKKLLDMAFKYDADVVAGNYLTVNTNG